MSSLYAKQLLLNAAQIAKKEKETFSKQEILQKINEIKYLSAQKKVPKLTLRKEIIHLENKLKVVIELENKMLKQQNRESAQITALKRQNKALKEQIKLAGNHDINKKVDKLTYLLGDSLAKKKVKEDVALTKTVFNQELKNRFKKRLHPDIIEKVKALERRIKISTQELKIMEELETVDKKEIEFLEIKIKSLQQSLDQFTAKHPELFTNIIFETKAYDIKHDMMFSLPLTKIVEELPKEELPLPPPPRVKE